MANKKRITPFLALRGMVVFPYMVSHLDVGRDKSIASLETAMMGDQKILLVSQKEVAVEDPNPEDLYRVGTMAKINQMLKLPNGTIRVLVEGLDRAKALEYNEQEKEHDVTYENLKVINGDAYEEEALMRQ